MLGESIIKKLESLRSRSIEIHEALAKEGATDHITQFTQLNKEYADITPIVDLFKSLQYAVFDLKDTVTFSGILTSVENFSNCLVDIAYQKSP